MLKLTAPIINRKLFILLKQRFIYDERNKNWGLYEGALYYMSIITLKDMTKAIENKLGLNHSQAQKLAAFIMDTFGYESRIIDNVLNPEERQLFYMLQSEGLLTAGREQTRLHDGREWLTYYWEIEDKTILYYAHKQKGRKKKPIFKTSPQNIYETLSEDMWLMRKTIRNMYS